MGYIKVNEIQQSQGNTLGSLLYASISAYYNNPENMQKFEEWKKRREEEKSNA